MERLTTRCAGHAVMAWEHEEQHTTQEWIDMLTDRLAEYEDTGLEPEDIKEICSDDVVELARMLRKMIETGEADRLVELEAADQEGRLVVLPAKTVRELTMAEKLCSDCLHYEQCSWGYCDNIKDRYYDIRAGKGDCWTAKEKSDNG